MFTTTNTTNGAMLTDSFSRGMSIASRSSRACFASSPCSCSRKTTFLRQDISTSNEMLSSSKLTKSRKTVVVTRASSDPSTEPSTSQSETPQSSKERTFGKNVDVEKYTIDQLAFLSRKEQGKKEGTVILPDYHNCAKCNGESIFSTFSVRLDSQMSEIWIDCLSSFDLTLYNSFIFSCRAGARVCVCELTSLAFFFLCRACTLSRYETLSYARKGTGKSFCSACQGSGINNHDIHDDFNSEVHIVGSTAENWRLIESTLGESTPCWLCRGKKIAICKDCRGTGCQDRDKLWVRV